MNHTGPYSEGRAAVGPWPARDRATRPRTRANVAKRRVGQDYLKVHTDTQRAHTCTRFSPSSRPAALLFGPCIPRHHSHTDNPANEGAATPGGAVIKET